MRKFTIILADDEQQILLGMKKGIDWDTLGFVVAGIAGNGKEALELVEHTHADLLISDIKMPFMDGLELSEIIHEKCMNTKIILFSGWGDFEYARKAISYGVSEYVMKPIDFENMKKLLQDMHERLEKEYDDKINRQRLEEIYRESQPLLRQQFFSQLVTGTINLSDLKQRTENLQLDFSYSAYNMVAIKIKNEGKTDVLSELSIKETIREALERIATVYEFGMYDCEIYLLCQRHNNYIDKIARIIEETAVLIQKIFSASVSCGIGKDCSEICEIQSLYKQTMEALEYNLAEKDECYTYYNDILPTDKNVSDWTEEAVAIEKIITGCTEDELRGEIDKILVKLHSAHYSISEYQIVILEILFAISHLYKKYQITMDEELAGSKKMAVKILSINTGKELDNWLFNYCNFIRSLIQKKQIDNNIVLAEQTKLYVSKNFMKPDLSVETMCDELHVSPSHFSKVFKQETGMTFINYLTGIRMQEAKRLLDKTDYKSHVIGEMVGYPEPNYFSYVFKKNCGVSPVKYRKQ